MYTTFENKLPIIILSSKRTGSTAIYDEICSYVKDKRNDVQNFSEPSENGRMSDLADAITQGFPFIMKVHCYDLVTVYPKQIIEFVNKCFLIRIRRKNLVNQIASHYVASQRNKWKYGPTEDNFEEVLSIIDFARINRSIKFILAYNHSLDNYTANISLDLYYEDLIFHNSNSLLTPKPSNYDVLKQTIAETLQRNTNSTLSIQPNYVTFRC
jgi:hypothetical protein